MDAPRAVRTSRERYGRRPGAARPGAGHPVVWGLDYADCAWRASRSSASAWRLHPGLCAFTSEVFYEGRLHSRDGLGRQKVEGHSWLGEAGLWFIPVQHEGNQNASPEEVECVADIVGSLVQPGISWIDEKFGKRPVIAESREHAEPE